MGEVYEAIDTRTGGRVAIEARLAAGVAGADALEIRAAIEEKGARRCPC